MDSTTENNNYPHPRIFCWVSTYPANHCTKAAAVRDTWGRRCDKILFVSNEDDPSLPAINLTTNSRYNGLWAKTKAAFRLIHEQHLNEADWFLKADDDSYIVMENLRALLRQHNPDEPIQFGCKLKQIEPRGYMSGGAGYVLSKEALRRFVNMGFNDEKVCKLEDDTIDGEDVEIGKCLRNLNVTAADSRDSQQRERFLPFMPEKHLSSSGNGDAWYRGAVFYPPKEGSLCCADDVISFHYVSEERMYELDYLIYRVGHSLKAPSEVQTV